MARRRKSKLSRGEKNEQSDKWYLCVYFFLILTSRNYFWAGYFSSSDGKKVSVNLSELRRLNVWYRNYLFSNSEVIYVGVSGEIVDAIVGWLRTGRLNSYREIRRILEAGLLYDFREFCNQIFEMLYEDMDKIEDRVLVDILMIEEDIFRVKAKVGREIVKRKIEVDEEVWKVLVYNVRRCAGKVE